MNLHEYQAKELFKVYKIPVLTGYVINDESEIKKQLRRIETDKAVIKAQIHAGGRGKGGGVKLVSHMVEAIEVAKAMLNKPLITHQTAEEGIIVRKLYVEEACNISKEWYLSLVLNRERACVSLVFSLSGGIDIESEDDSKIKTIDIDPDYGLKDYELTALIEDAKVSHKIKREFIKLVKNLYKLYLEKDALLIEINPLVITAEDELIALDGKMHIDANALYRQEDLLKYKDPSEDVRDSEAAEHGLAYVALKGDIACMVNGAGLALATLDAINHHGGSPANFLDVGGSARPEQMTKAFEIILKDKNVKGIFINIFGGIMKGEYVARGIIDSQKMIKQPFPIVLRLEGTGAEAGKALLKKENINIKFVDDLDAGAKEIVALCGGIR